MIQFGIVIPFRPKAESVNWMNECRLLRQTIHSVLQQTYAGFRVFVVYTDMPDEPVPDPRVFYAEFPYGYQYYEEIAEREKLKVLFKSEKMTVRRWDKGRKLTYGSALAKESGCDYIMALDADDLLSNRLLAYLAAEAETKDCKGWYMEKGYLYNPKTNMLVKVPYYMRFLNGSTHILSAGLVTIPDFRSTDWHDYSLFTSHGWVKDRLYEKFGAVLEPIPFEALVYVVHESNISKVYKKEFGLSFKNLMKWALRTTRVTNKLREEFAI